MASTKLFSRRTRLDAPPPPTPPGEQGPWSRPLTSRSGIALFMVISAMTVLALLVTEFTYIAQVNQRMAYDGLDQVRAHYLAKTGFKLSLLRLKAYQTVKNVTGGAGGAMSVPGSLLDKIWNFPFLFPISKDMPGLTVGAKTALEKFNNETGLVGNFTAVITSESSKANLNQFLPGFVAPAPSPQPSASPSPGSSPAANPNPVPSPSPSFDPEAARGSFTQFVAQILNQKIEDDPDFAQEYRDLRVDDLTDAIFGWADRTYQRRTPPKSENVPEKRAPFYSVSELHMIPEIEDEIYALLAPHFTATLTQGVNVNTISATLLRALVPAMTKPESDEFFKYRDSTEQDNRFKSDADFFKWLEENVAGLRSQSAVKELQADLQKRNIRILVDESSFKITVQAQVNQTIRLLEAWVELDSSPSTSTPSASDSNSGPNGSAPPASPSNPTGGVNAQASKPKTGLRMTFMRIL